MSGFRTGGVFALGAFLFLPPPHLTKAQQKAEWIWTDGYGTARRKADLDRILQDHKLWVTSKGKQGKCADLSSADLRDADLFQADLQGANFLSANLGRARLTGAILEDAYLNNADLSSADLGEAHMGRVNLINAELKDARLHSADLQGVIFEPKSMPEIRFVAGAEHLEFVTYWKTPTALVQLRKQFQEGGFRTQERKITYALNRRQAELDGPFERWFKKAAFDWTCQYGMSPGRLLRILAGLWLLCSGLNYLFIRFSKHSGLYVVPARREGEQSKEGKRRETTRFRQIQKIGKTDVKSPALLSILRRSRTKSAVRSQRRAIQHWLKLKWRSPRAAMFFSLISAFNIGYRELNLGQWLRMLTKREYEIKAVGCTRVLAGWQSLTSLYLIALWLLTYFGRPFE